jgi:hypothetical protein
MGESNPEGGTEHIAEATEKVSFERSEYFLVYTTQLKYLTPEDKKEMQTWPPSELDNFLKSIHVARNQLWSIYQQETQDTPQLINDFIRQVTNKKEDFENYKKQTETVLDHYDQVISYLQSLPLPSLFTRYILALKLGKTKAKEQFYTSLYEHAEKQVDGIRGDFQDLRDKKKRLLDNNKKTQAFLKLPAFIKWSVFSMYKRKFKNKAMEQIDHFVGVESMRIQDLEMMQQVFADPTSDSGRLQKHIEKCKALLLQSMHDNLDSLLSHEVVDIDAKFPVVKSTLQEAFAYIPQLIREKYPELNSLASDLDREKPRFS